MTPEPLEAAFFARPVLDVAPELVGCVVWHGETSGVIVETEAYHHSEAACHAHVGRTARTHVLFGAPGTAYVYRSYGIHALLNVVCEPDGVAAAVLLRALEPLTGVETMRARRRVRGDLELSNGPGKLTQALDVELHHNRSSLQDGPVIVAGAAPGWEAPELVVGPRVGITKAAELPWRWCARASRYVSRPWPPGMRRA